VKVFLNSKSGTKKLADAEIAIDEGELRGCIVRGFNVWTGKGPGEIFVTPPNSKYQGRDGKTKYWHHLCEESDGALTRVKSAIEEAYRAKLAGDSQGAPDNGDDIPF
jgi:hypothetical protein